MAILFATLAAGLAFIAYEAARAHAWVACLGASVVAVWLVLLALRSSRFRR